MEIKQKLLQVRIDKFLHDKLLLESIHYDLPVSQVTRILLKKKLIIGCTDNNVR